MVFRSAVRTIEVVKPGASSNQNFFEIARAVFRISFKPNRICVYQATANGIDIRTDAVRRYRSPIVEPSAAEIVNTTNTSLAPFFSFSFE